MNEQNENPVDKIEIWNVCRLVFRGDLTVGQGVRLLKGYDPVLLRETMLTAFEALGLDFYDPEIVGLERDAEETKPQGLDDEASEPTE